MRKLDIGETVGFLYTGYQDRNNFSLFLGDKVLIRGTNDIGFIHFYDEEFAIWIRASESYVVINLVDIYHDIEVL